MKHKKYTFEVCAGNWQSALAAERAGADRIELCSALEVGGVTPSYGLIEQVVSRLKIPVCVLIRPREGDFCYDEEEIDLMCKDIAFCHEQGVMGVVIGALKPDNRIDEDALKRMIAASGGMDLVFHRAFDFVEDPLEAVDQLIALGFKRILSSGQEESAYLGRAFLCEMILFAEDQIEIMPGAGISAQNIRHIAEETGARQFHFTAKQRISGQGRGLPGLDLGHWESSVEEIQKIIGLLP